MPESYFDWLCGLVKEPDRINQGVLRVLFEVEFFELVPNDHNRALDGLALREEARDRSGTYPIGATPCTVLEMMIALSRHMDDMSSAIGAPERPSYWFWRMINNLGLDYTLLPFHDTERRFAEGVVLGLVNRTYSTSGLGGLFPLIPHHDPPNQRVVEIWYQMQRWLSENL